MKTRYLPVFILLAAVLSLSLVHAQAPPIPGVSTSSSLLTGLSSANSPMYAGFFAIVMFIIFAIALDRTQLSSGRISISFIFALITFFILYTDPVLLHFFLNAFIVLAFIALVLGMLVLVKSPRSIKLIGLLIVLFLLMVLFENDTSLTNSINSTLHISLLNILPFVFGMIAVLIFAVLLIKGIRNSRNTAVRVALLFIVFLMITLLIPGFAGFLFNPIVLTAIFVAIILAAFIYSQFGKIGRIKPSKLDKQYIKDAKLQQNVLNSIGKRKKANSSTLDRYKSLINKGSLTTKDQLKLSKLKNKLGDEAWKNVADRTKLSKVQYSQDQLSNNKDLQQLTGAGPLPKSKVLKDLQSKAERNYKLSWSQRRAFSKEQKNLSNKNNFIKNVGNSQAGDLFDLAKGVNKGALGPVPSEKAAKRMFDKRISKEARNKDVTDLFNERNKLLDPTLNLSYSTRRKELAKIDKKLKKISKNINPQSPDQIRQKDILKMQNNQMKQEMMGDQKLADAQFEAARKNAEREREEQRMLEEQARLAEAARQQAEQQRMLEEQARLAEAARQQADYDRIMKEQSYNLQNAKRDAEKIKKEDNDNLDRNPSKEMEQQIDEINEYLKQTERQGKKPSNPASDKNQSKMFTIPIFGKKNNGMFRRKVVEDTGKNAEMSKETGTDVNNAKVIAGSNMTQAETRMFELSQEAYNNPDPVVGQKIINLIKSRHDDILKIKDTNDRNKAEAQLEKEVQNIIKGNK